MLAAIGAAIIGCLAGGERQTDHAWKRQSRFCHHRPARNRWYRAGQGTG